MTKNPVINALLALVYITVIASTMFYASEYAPKSDSIVAPIMIVSLFTLSTAVMGYLFGYQPFQLYFDNKKKLAADLFLKTVGVFGGLTAIILILYLSGIFS